MANTAPNSPNAAGVFRVADLATRHPTRFDLQPDADTRAALAGHLDLLGLRKLRFTGEIIPLGKRGWRLTAMLGATVVQPCVVTLRPVTTRIDDAVTRHYVPAADLEPQEPGTEVEMPEDDTTEALAETISAHDAMAEALALALPLYPRATDAELGEAVYAEDGTVPLRDGDLKPFAGLASLRDKLDGTE
ncbi:DUF177 domain-containing protein [Puniceibacterium sp. IMCC21224]|uniref:YceD family protein n=1 Tax=Puniceibacterium sp. IMCC21224 TaxID=1618204 RepID=UPI00064D76AD|nr:YceD family protein [Puniceibacterium sp. IMCC21224]KMK67383.1 putative metal-binding protein [Puniceibacterium sp. IMCC21224]